MSIKVITGKVRASFVHVFEPQSINGSEPKYSCSLIIPKSDTVTVQKIKAAMRIQPMLTAISSTPPVRNSPAWSTASA